MNIALVCDFFYPRLGGVEMHIYSLASTLAQLGHRIIIITHAYDDNSHASHQFPERNTQRVPKRTGVRYLPGPIKVYYCPFLPMTDQVLLPTFTVTFPLLRWIFLREQIDLVHAHQATSTLAHEAIVYASELGLASVYTDHSLFGLEDGASVVLNYVLTTTLSTVGAVICVSHACRDNLILRAHVDPKMVHVIPNAIDASKFQPCPSKPCSDRIKVIVVSRLVYRKGVDLLVGLIPILCKKFSMLDFIIGGDGSKKIDLVEMIERERLEDRVTLLGAIAHQDVPSVLVQGHIFLNCSLTESFCIAILEAAACGLYVVSTNVGGVPEVLPQDSMIHLSEPTISAMVDTLSDAIHSKITRDANGNVTMSFDPFEFHNRIVAMYSWYHVTQRTISVYQEVLQKPKFTFWQRLERYKSVGTVGGYIVCILHLILVLVVNVIQWFQPSHMIDTVPQLFPIPTTTEPIRDGTTITDRSCDNNKLDPPRYKVS